MFRSLPPLLLAGVSAFSILPAFAADVAVPSRIEAVTVFPDGATVTRGASVQIPAGSSVLVFQGLSPLIDPSSIRVEGRGGAALSVGSVDLRVVPGEARASVNAELEAKIEAARRQQAAVKGQIEAAEGKRAAIQAFARPPETPAGTTALPIEQWTAAWDAIGGALEKVGETLTRLRADERRLIAEIAALEAARPRGPGPAAPRRDVVVGVDAAAVFEGTLKLTYRTGGANWRPLYDARLDTGARDRKPSLELVRRAMVTQKTGEDWSDVTLTVSTVRTAQGTAAPELNPVLMTFWEPEVVMARKVDRTYAAPAPAIARLQADESAKRAAEAPQSLPVVEDAAQMESTTFQSAFRVPGSVSLSGDGTQRNLLLSSRRFEPTLVVKTAPALDETAYLETSFINEDEAALLPGDVSLQRDGTFIGRGRLALVATGDKVDLGFGADDKVKVTRSPVRRKESEPGWTGSTRTDTREFRTVVKNLHDTPLRIVVTDQVPVSENTAIVIETLPTTTTATEKQVGDKRGVMAWSWDYQPGEQKEVRLGYRVKWPADREITVGGGIPYRR